jgi:hypothetical protein
MWTFNMNAGELLILLCSNDRDAIGRVWGSIVPLLHRVAGKVKISLCSSLDICGVSNESHAETMHYASDLSTALHTTNFLF